MASARRIACSGFLVALLVSCCMPTGVTRQEAIQAAMRNAPRSGVPVTVESAVDGRLDQFYVGFNGEEAGRHVWAVELVGSFAPPMEGEDLYRHHVVIVDYTTGEVMFGYRLAVQP